MNDLGRKRNMNEKISVVIPVKNDAKKMVTMVYYDYGMVRRIGQVMRVCEHDVGFTDVRMYGCWLHPCENVG